MGADHAEPRRPQLRLRPERLSRTCREAPLGMVDQVLLIGGDPHL